MSAAELKLKIIDKVSSIEDEIILKEILKLVDLESEIDSVYKLTDKERKAVDAGFKDISEGKVYSSEAAEKMIQEWLKSSKG
ncbi:MAG TPA: hypothetical protein VL443_01095 [Cyclobacteriaceae bacterium]|jgi:hypothetical protein|nr:hypothetical protein [Cyclobacteriaceae bacterium]